MRTGRRRWTVTGFNSDDQTRELTSIAYCANKRLWLKARSKEATTAVDADLSSRVSCKRGEVAVSGGFDGGLTSDETGITLLYESQRAGKRAWRSSAGGYPGDAESIELGAYVYCMKKG